MGTRGNCSTICVARPPEHVRRIARAICVVNSRCALRQAPTIRSTRRLNRSTIQKCRREGRWAQPVVFRRDRKTIGAETGGKFEVRAKKAFRNPIIKPCATNQPPHRIRRIKIEEKLEPSVTVRGGAAALGEMCSYRLGLDSSGRFAIEPQYAVKLGRGGAFVGQKTATISDAVVLSTASGRKWINLRKHDYLAIQWDSTATREPRRVEGYLHQYESDGRLTLRRHDQAIIENSGENCHYRSTDWTGAIAIQIFRVSVVGELELIEECTRTSPKALARRKTERASASGSGGDTNTP